LGRGVAVGCEDGADEVMLTLIVLVKVAVPFTPNAELEVTTALLLVCGVSVQLISLNQPFFQVMVLPLTTAGCSPSFILTDVPSAFMKKETGGVPDIPCWIMPDQLPENLAGPEVTEGWRGSLFVVVVWDFDL